MGLLRGGYTRKYAPHPPLGSAARAILAAYRPKQKEPGQSRAQILKALPRPGSKPGTDHAEPYGFGTGWLATGVAAPV